MVQNQDTPCTRNTKEAGPHCCALFFLTKEVTSAQKPRSHSLAQLSPKQKRKAVSGCSISAVRKGSAEGVETTQFLSSHTRSSLPPSLNCTLCCDLITPLLTRLLEVGPLSPPQRPQPLPCYATSNHLVSTKQRKKEPAQFRKAPAWLGAAAWLTES